MGLTRCYKTAVFYIYSILDHDIVARKRYVANRRQTRGAIIDTTYRRDNLCNRCDDYRSGYLIGYAQSLQALCKFEPIMATKIIHINIHDVSDYSKRHRNSCD